MKRLRSALLCACTCVLGCDSDPAAEPQATAASGEAKAAEGGASAEAKPEGETKPEAKPTKPGAPDPCAELSEDELRAAAKIANDATVEIKSKKFSKTVCDYTWLNKGDTGLFSGKVSVGVTPKPFADEAGAIAGFKKAIAGLSESMTAGGKAPKFDDIANVGDEASWWGSFGQLSTRKGDKIIYVTVAGQKADVDARLELAKALTAVILGG